MTLAIAPVIAREVRNERRKAEYRPSRPARPYNGSPGEVDLTLSENLLYAVGGCGPSATNFVQNSASTRIFMSSAVPRYLPSNPALKIFATAKIFSQIFTPISYFLRMPLHAAWNSQIFRSFTISRIFELLRLYRLYLLFRLFKNSFRFLDFSLKIHLFIHH